MTPEEEKVQVIKKAFFEYTAHNILSACDTPGYFARQILTKESFFLKANVIADLIESKVMVIDNGKWIIKNEVTKTATTVPFLFLALQLPSDRININLLFS
jgi:hypothetical protein